MEALEKLGEVLQRCATRYAAWLNEGEEMSEPVPQWARQWTDTAFTAGYCNGWVDGAEAGK